MTRRICAAFCGVFLLVKSVFCVAVDKYEFCRYNTAMKKVDRKKVVVVTGASSGIGLAAAKMLKNLGYVVYGIARRNFEADFPYYSADVTDANRIKEIFGEIFAKEGALDALVNNAGMGISGAVEDLDPAAVQKQFDVNVVALVCASSAALPYLRKSGGKIINVGSVAGAVPIPYQACYSASKAAVESFSRALRSEVLPLGVDVTCVMPGDTKTGFTAARQKFGEGANSAYKGKADKSVAKMEKDEKNGVPAEKVAKVICKMLKKRRLPVRKTVGISYKLLVGLAKILPSKFVDAIVRKLY